MRAGAVDRKPGRQVCEAGISPRWANAGESGDRQLVAVEAVRSFIHMIACVKLNSEKSLLKVLEILRVKRAYPLPVTVLILVGSRQVKGVADLSVWSLSVPNRPLD